MSHYSDSEITRFESGLRRRRDRVLATIGQRLHQSGNTDEMALRNYFSDVREPAGADVLGDTDIALLELELAELGDIDEALSRLRAGSYGSCAACGSRISPRRLRAQPAARMCLPCQETAEKPHASPLAHG